MHIAELESVDGNERYDVSTVDRYASKCELNGIKVLYRLRL